MNLTIDKLPTKYTLVNTHKTQSNNCVCAVCGYRQLANPQRTTSGGASHEICPACGYESGYSDDVQGITYEQWRATWVTLGLQWFSKGIAKPKDWNPMREIHALLRRKRPVISARILAQVAAAKLTAEDEAATSQAPATIQKSNDTTLAKKRIAS